MSFSRLGPSLFRPMSSGGFRPGPGESSVPFPSFAPGPSNFVATYDFCKITQISDFLCFQIVEKSAICGFHWTSKNQKFFSFRGASPPVPITKGSVFGPRWGLCPPGVRYRLALYRARHGAGRMGPCFPGLECCGLEPPLPVRVFWKSFNIWWCHECTNVRAYFTSHRLWVSAYYI